MELSAAGFLIPYLLVYNPAMMMIDTSNVAVDVKEFPMASIASILWITISAIIGIVALSAAIEGYFKTHMNFLFRFILALGALCLIIPETDTDFIGIVLVSILLTFNYVKGARLRKIRYQKISNFQY